MKTKRIYIWFFFILLVVGGSFFASKIYLFYAYSPKKIKTFVTNFFYDNLNKAVKFEGIEIDYKANLVITDFALSVTNDFNDNLSLIKADKLVIDLNYTSLLFKEKVIIQNLKFIRSEISVFKQYGDFYLNGYEILFYYKDLLGKIDCLKQNQLLVSFEDSKIFYSEIYKDRKILLKTSDTFAEIYLAQDRIDYNISASLDSYRPKNFDGQLTLSGFFMLDKTKSLEVDLEIKKFDALYFNDFIKIYKWGDYLSSGEIGGQLKIVSNKEQTDFKGVLKTDDFSLISFSPRKYSLISDLDLKIELDLSVFSHWEHYLINKVRIFDDVFRIDLAGKYLNDHENDFFELDFNTNKIVLGHLSDYFTPFSNYNYKGELLATGGIKYNFKENQASDWLMNLVLKNFELSKFNGTQEEILISKGDFSLTCKDKEVAIASTVNAGKSDLALNSTTEIFSWSPFKSETKIDLKSSNLSFSLLAKSLVKGWGSLYGLAYQDKQKGYEEVYFTQKTIGKIVNQNNLLLNYEADKINFGSQGHFNNLLFELSLSKGILNLRNFHLQGYGAAYRLKADGLFNKYYPSLDILGTISSFDLESFSKDYGTSAKWGGVLNLNFDYSLNAYRLAHLLQNTRASFNFQIKNGLWGKCNWQKRLNNYFHTNNYSLFDLEEINFSNFSFTFSQAGENFRLRNLNLRSDKVIFYAYGRYYFSSGWRVPFYSTFYDINNKGKGVSLEFKGSFLDPVLCLSRKKEDSCFLFFEN